MNGKNDWRGVLEMIRRAATARGRASSGYFSIEGIRLHERALRAGQRVKVAVAAESFFLDTAPRVQALRDDLRTAGCRLVAVPDDVLRKETGGRDLGAIIGIVPLPDPPNLAGLIHEKHEYPPLILVAADVKDPGNTGALLRTALASGATAFAACGISDPYHPKAVRTSMGSLFKLPVLIYSDAEECLTQLAQHGMMSLGLAVVGSQSLPQIAVPARGVAVMVGSEAQGLPSAVQQRLDFLVSIPMRDGVDSYSVNAAAAIALYEIGRQRLNP